MIGRVISHYRILEKRDPFLIHLVLDPRLDDLRGDLRFAVMLRRMGWRFERGPPRTY